LEATENAVFLGQQPASALERIQTALRGSQASLQAAQVDAAAHQAKEARLTSLAQAIEADAAAIVAQHLQAAYQEAVSALDQRIREVVEALQPVRALHALARKQFSRMVLPFIEPIARPLQPYQLVGFEDLCYLFEHDPDAQRLLGDSA
jgi:hypothetical protein